MAEALAAYLAFGFVLAIAGLLGGIKAATPEQRLDLASLPPPILFVALVLATAHVIVAWPVFVWRAVRGEQ